MIVKVSLDTGETIGFFQKNFPDYPVDKILHGAAYMVLSFLLCYEAHWQWKCAPLRSRIKKRVVDFMEFTRSGSLSSEKLLMVFLFAALFGLFLEFCQMQFTAFRRFDMFDFLANIIGAATGVIIYVLMSRKYDA